MADQQQERQQASTPVFAVRVDGSELPLAARGSVTRVVVAEGIDVAGTFAVELSNWDLDRHAVAWSDDQLFDPGRALELDLGYVEGTTTVMKGEITGLEVSFPAAAAAVLTVRGYDRLHRFRGGRRTRSYLQVKDSDVAQKIAGDLGLTGDVEDSGEVHDYLLQTNQSDVDFLLTRARAIDYELAVDDKTLQFRRSRNDRGKADVFSFTHGLLAFDAYLSTADQVSSVSVRGWDPATKKALVGKAAVSDVRGAMKGSQSGPAATRAAFGDRALAVVEQPVATQNEADLLARGLLNELALGYVVGEGTILGNPKVAAGMVLELEEIGTRFSGLYYVTDVEHVWDGRYLTHIRVKRNAS